MYKQRISYADYVEEVERLYKISDYKTKINLSSFNFI